MSLRTIRFLSLVGLAALALGSPVASAAAAPGGGTGAPGAASGPSAGKDLFTGATQFTNGGPSCLSCHSIAGIGSLGGGALGPDLTGAYVKYGGDKGMAAVLASLPFPTMQPIFKGRSLTPAEQADLLAFLNQASHAQRPGGAIWKLVLLGLAAAGLGLALAFVIWRRRRLVVRSRIAPTYTPTDKED